LQHYLPEAAVIAVTVLTGYLGAGKTRIVAAGQRRSKKSGSQVTPRRATTDDDEHYVYAIAL
jgi:hypothetical protein